MSKLELMVVGVGRRTIKVNWIFNGGYAGRDHSKVQYHINELAALGVPAPKSIPTLYPLSNHLISQKDHLQAPHALCSGEAEWAMIIGDDENDILIAAACDHTDRALEVYGIAWSKQSFPDMIGDVAWQYNDIEKVMDAFTLKAWVRHGETEELIQNSLLNELLPPRFWIERLREAGLLRPGTLVLSGTIGMIEGVNPFAEGWRVEMADSIGNISKIAYTIETLPAAWE